MVSPYSVSVGPSLAKLRMFFGRRHEARMITDYLARGDSVLLIGERRIGKTFLLYMISGVSERVDFYEELLDRDTGELLAELHRSLASYRWAFVDLLSVTSVEGFYFNILATLAGEQVEQFLALSPMNSTTFLDQLTQLSTDLSQSGQGAFVLVDETEKLLDWDRSAEVFSCLKAVAQQCQAIRLVLAGDIKSHQDTVEFANLKGVLRPVYLGPLDSEDARALIKVPVAGYLSFEDLTLERILELTGGKPCLIQILCDHLYELLLPEDDPPIHVTVDQFDQLWESELRNRVFDSFDGALRDFFEALPDDEDDIFAFLAHQPLATEEELIEALGINPASVRSSLHSLQTTHRIAKTASGYRLSAKIVEEYGARFFARPTAPTPTFVPAAPSLEVQGSILRTNLKHHAKELSVLVSQWQGVKIQEEIEDWLLMFEEHERDVAIKLLGNVRYYSQRDLEKFFSILHGKLLRATGQRGLKHIWFFPVGGSSKSGQMMLYLYRMVNGLNVSRFPAMSMLPAFQTRGVQFLAFVDDFIGTGKQMTNFWHEELAGEPGIERAELYCLVLLGFKEGIEYVQAQTPFTVICIEILDERDRAFSPECTIFSSDEERKRAKEICLQYGEILCPGFPLGYDDSQALIAFEYQTPNNSLPILWSNEKGWTPIFERKG